MYPNASFAQSADWCNFNATFGSVTLLEPNDPLFLQLGTAMNKAMLAAFGDPSGEETPYLNADTFNGETRFVRTAQAGR